MDHMTAAERFLSMAAGMATSLTDPAAQCDIWIRLSLAHAELARVDAEARMTEATKQGVMATKAFQAVMAEAMTRGNDGQL